jgi:hypothetical protein
VHASNTYSKYISTSFPKISKAPSAHRLSLSLRSAVAVQCSLSLGRLSSPRLRYSSVETWNTLAFWKPGRPGRRRFPCRPCGCGVTLSVHPRITRTRTTPPANLLQTHSTCTLSQSTSEGTGTSTTHNPQPSQQMTKKSDVGLGTAVRSFPSINQLISGSHGLRCARSLNFPPTSK